MNSSETMCERCDGLCCRVYDIFDHATGKLVKKAWEKCWYLDIKNQCRIHTTRDRHPGYAETCTHYDCLEAGPIVSIFARRISLDTPMRYAMISSLLEVIRLRIATSPSCREEILDYSAILLMNITIDETLMIAIRIARVKIERWENV